MYLSELSKIFLFFRLLHFQKISIVFSGGAMNDLQAIVITAL